MNKLYILLITALFIAGCGGSDDSDDSETGTGTTETGTGTGTETGTGTGTGTETGSSTRPPVQTPQLASFNSAATVTTETAFNDSYTAGNTADIAWSGPTVNNSTSIDYIAEAFNTARTGDLTVNEKLRMPQQATWDSYNASQKVIYLINSERSARGLRPFRGIDDNLVTSSGNYASELSDNGQFSHTYGTYPTTTARLEGWAGVVAPAIPPAASAANVNSTFNTYHVEELISYIEVASGSSIHEHEARAVYNFMYEDKSPTIGGAYAHRKSILIVNPVTASGQAPAGLVDNAQPLIGASFVEGIVSGSKRNTLVIHGIDPNDNWDITGLTIAPGLIGPEAASDCLRGTYTPSVDASGTNNSTCE